MEASLRADETHQQKLSARFCSARNEQPDVIGARSPKRVCAAASVGRWNGLRDSRA
jgi:hypothetical protein